MSDKAHFDREIAAGAAMLQAGNVDAAIRHCKNALDIRPTDIDSYSLQIDILSAKERPAEALRLTEARLEQSPDCRWSHLNRIRLNARLGRSGLSRKARDEAILLFADDPMMVHDANLLYDICQDRNRNVLKRIRKLRKEGYWGVYDLRSLEQIAHANSSHVHTLGKLQQQDLEDGYVDAETLHSQAKVRFLQGRLIQARRLAIEAAELDPANAPEYAETRVSATLGMIPLMWGAQVFIVLTGSLTSRFPWILRIFLNYALAVACLILTGFILMPLSAIPGVPEASSDRIIGTIGLANVAWALYVIWAWGSIGRMRARKRSVGLSKDY